MIKKIMLLLLSILAICVTVDKVSAEEISYKKIEGVYYNIWLEDGNLQSNNVTMFYFQNKLAYCIEPGIAITDKNYNTSRDWQQTNFNDEQQIMLEKIGYYGYEYPGHQTANYYLAAQELIWNISNPNAKIVWTSEKNNNGSKLNYEKEKEEILTLVKNDKIRPSFSTTKITGEVGSSLVIKDENNVLDNYDLNKSQYHNLKIENNNLVIEFNENVVPLETIKLVRKNYDNQTFIVYFNGNSQKLATLRFSKPVETFFEIENMKPLKKEEVEKPEIVKVPNTSSNYSYLISIMCFIGAGYFRIKKLL